MTGLFTLAPVLLCFQLAFPSWPPGLPFKSKERGICTTQVRGGRQQTPDDRDMRRADDLIWTRLAPALPVQSNTRAQPVAIAATHL